MRKIYALLLFCLTTILSYGQMNERTLSDQAIVSVITCGTGDQLYSLFGHTAIRIYDPIERIDRVYNYGMFDFRAPNFYGKFVKGDLLYFATYDSYRDFVMNYMYDDRAVYEQVLNLTQQQKQKVFDELSTSLLEENKYYVYKFIDQNCTTKVVDILNKVIPTPVKVDVEGNTTTYRTILNSYLKSRYFEMLGINLIFGSKVNKESNLLFLPDKFMLGLAETKINNQPLVSETIDVFVPQNNKQGIWWDTMWFASVIALFFAVAVVNSFVRKTFLFLLGLLGLFFFGVAFYSLHSELLWNNSILLCSPLFLLLPFVKKEYTWRGKYNLAVIVSVLAFTVVNIVSQKLFVSLPLVLLTYFAVALEFQLINIVRVKKE
ncbi:MAG: DUF4105 domain-containing protein [Flavobacteriaceae bacterium]|jgi:hypothetical protein|nr:DUF4105 domain-containing protein [Flavobacteriaceae bacterium]